MSHNRPESRPQPSIPTGMVDRMLRRRFLQIGGAGFLGLTLPRLLRAEGGSTGSGPAKSVIFLYQFGGPSHLDTFDMKPDAAEGIRGPLGSIPSAVPGMPVCEHLPEMAKIMDKVTLIRSMHHTMKNHNSASYYALTGHAPPVDDIRLRDSDELFPAYGSIVDRFAPNDDGMPTFVAYPHVIRDGAITPGQRATFLGKAHDPLLVTEDPNDPNFALPELSLPDTLDVDRLQNRRALQQIVNQQTRLLDYSATARGIDAYYEKALSMLNSKRVRDAFNLAAEPDSVRDRYGRSEYGQSCLLARRLVEAGVRFVNVYFSSSIGGQSTTSGGWDTHGFNNTRMYPIIKARHLPITDQTLPTLINDLDERGLLDDTLIVWMGEFGRTPKINGNISRDHWPQCYTTLLAGGGVKRGFVYGESDRNGAYPAVDMVRPDDLAATMFSLLGIDPETEIRDPLDRPFPIAGGRPVTGVMA
ncbi:hypothetical protein Mal4_11640 [Maioricimonas rarisocia]|uniref:Sulfatase n=1 Tax=Maioricimonas rarisocia TaxID=2528026 RepID=A0A517Z315_9PLAN|nr:DUF1501 domain-containing protein [Maioricimonas rarisocia]QDU36863.1 hypothetical protein Mal4_11640 [Maioricimonas rarisocia]